MNPFFYRKHKSSKHHQPPEPVPSETGLTHIETELLILHFLMKQDSTFDTLSRSVKEQALPYNGAIFYVALLILSQSEYIHGIKSDGETTYYITPKGRIFYTGLLDYYSQMYQKMVFILNLLNNPANYEK